MLARRSLEHMESHVLLSSNLFIPKKIIKLHKAKIVNETEFHFPKLVRWPNILFFSTFF